MSELVKNKSNIFTSGTHIEDLLSSHNSDHRVASTKDTQSERDDEIGRQMECIQTDRQTDRQTGCCVSTSSPGPSALPVGSFSRGGPWGRGWLCLQNLSRDSPRRWLNNPDVVLFVCPGNESNTRILLVFFSAQLDLLPQVIICFEVK